MRNDQVKASSIPCISFDLKYTKSVAGSEDEQVGTMIALIYVDRVSFDGAGVGGFSSTFGIS